MINFIGIGSAFNTELGNTSAFVRKNNILLLIDCGGTVFHRLQQLSILNGLENIYIIITHTHPDHVGSLGDLIFYSYYFLRNKATIIFPDKEFIERFLFCVGVSSEMYSLKSTNKSSMSDEQLGEFSIEFLPVSHVDKIPSYGFIMKLNDRSFYYSGDSNNISNEIIDKLKDGEIDRIYQDTCGLDYEGNNHLSLKKLSEIISQEYKNKVYCMHLDKYINQQEIKDNGFNVVEIYKIWYWN